MSKKLKEIFKGNYSKYISVTWGDERLEGCWMDEERFVKIVTKLLKQKSTGEKHINLKELHKYFDV